MNGEDYGVGAKFRAIPRQEGQRQVARYDYQIVEYTPNSKLIVSQVNADAKLTNDAQMTQAAHMGHSQGAALRALHSAGLKVPPRRPQRRPPLAHPAGRSTRGRTCSPTTSRLARATASASR